MLSDKYRKNPEYYKEKGKNWRAANPEKYAEQRKRLIKRQRQRLESDPEYREEYNRKCRERYHSQKLQKREHNLLLAARSRAKKLNREFTIAVDDFVIPDICPILGIRLYTNEGYGRDDSPSLDRIDNSKGYVPGNVHVISRKANAMKAHASREELVAFAAWVIDNEAIL